MIVGRDLWNAEITGDMVTSTVNGRRVDVFPDAPRSLYQSLLATTQRCGAAIGIVDDGGHPWTYEELLGEVERLAAYLSDEYSVGHGDRVGVLLDTSVEFCIATYALNQLGAIIVPLPTKYRPSEIGALVNRSQLRIALADDAYVHSLDDFSNSGGIVVQAHATPAGHGFTHLPLPESGTRLCSGGPEDDAMLMYTSGTTTLSKGVLLTNANVAHTVIAYQRILEITEEDSTIIPVPIYHVTGLVALMCLFVHSGARIHLHNRFDANRVLEDVRTHSITLIHASPTVFEMLLGEAANFPDLPSLRVFACGAAHMPVIRIDALHRWLPRMSFRTIYGLTETTSPGSIMDSDAATSQDVGSSGRLIPGVNASILRKNGDEAEFEERGEICLYGSNILRRYDHIEESGLSEDGWLCTGDVGYLNKDGYLFVVDRIKDMINRGGEKIWCIDVEEELRRIPGVSDAAVVGIPDAKYGEVPSAIVVVDPGFDMTGDLIRARLRTRLASYQVPVAVSFVNRIPLTLGTKVDKRTIRAELIGPARG